MNSIDFSKLNGRLPSEGNPVPNAPTVAQLPAPTVAQLIIALLIVWMPACVYAEELESILLKDKIAVHAQASEESAILRTYGRGEHLSAAPVKDTAKGSVKDTVKDAAEGNWRKVRVRAKGIWKWGFARREELDLVSDATNAQAHQMTDAAPNRSGDFHHKYSLGVRVAFSSLMQGASPVDSSTGVALTKGALSGSSLFFGVGGLIPLSSRLVLSSDIRFRQLNLSGNFSYGGSGNNTYQLTESYVGSSAILRSYFHDDGNWWWGGGLEFSYGSQPSILVNNGVALATTGTSSSYNYLLLVELAAGADYHLFGSFFVLPELRAGYVALFSPYALAAEAHVGLAYAF